MNRTHISLAIFFGCILISGAILANSKSSQSIVILETLDSVQISRQNNNHLYGLPDAKIRIVEFSDFECPFCSKLHSTLKRLVDESDGKVVWEYRHLPLDKHQQARPAAVISECISKFISQEAFWLYSENIFALLGNLDSGSVKQVAIQLGLTDTQIDNCLVDEELLSLVETDAKAAQAVGARGTPHSIIITEDGRRLPVSGALPYEQWLNLIKN